MKLENRCLVPASADKTWALLMDITQAAPCIPGVQDVIADGENQFKAVMQVRIGPVRLNFSGTINVLEQDKEKGEARFRVEAADRRVGGSIRAEMTMQLNHRAAEETEMVIRSDTVFMRVGAADYSPQSQFNPGRLRSEPGQAGPDLARQPPRPRRS